MPLIEVEHLVYEYVKTDDYDNTIVQRAVDDVSFSIEAGSFVSICGINGSGKSTLAKCLNGLLIPTSGKVLINGMDTFDDDLVWDIRETVGMVFQNPDNQIVSSIVEDDVAFGPENLGIPPEEIRIRVDDALRQVDMYKHKDKGAHMLSGGQKQRVAIAGAIAMKPDCIVFDEPTAMLDPRGRHRVMEIIKKLNSDGITVIMITHFMSEAAMADRIIVMKDGRIYCDSSPRELFGSRELTVGAGLEMPPVVDLRDRIASYGVEIPASIMDEESLIDYIESYK